MSRTARVSEGSANVFADLGFPNPDEMLAKSELVRQINRTIDERGLTQVETAKLLGVNQPKISALKRGRLTDFSLERLMRFLIALGHQVTISLQPAPNARLIVTGARRSRVDAFKSIRGR